MYLLSCIHCRHFRGSFDGSKEVKKRFATDLFGNYALLACLFVLLLFLDLLHCQVLANPFDGCGLAFHWLVIHKIEFLGQHFVSDDIVFSHLKDDSKVVRAFFVDYFDVLDAVQKWLISFPH